MQMKKTLLAQRHSHSDLFCRVPLKNEIEFKVYRFLHMKYHLPSLLFNSIPGTLAVQSKEMLVNCGIGSKLGVLRNTPLRAIIHADYRHSQLDEAFRRWRCAR